MPSRLPQYLDRGGNEEQAVASEFSPNSNLVVPTNDLVMGR